MKYDQSSYTISLRSIWPYGRGYRTNDGNISHHWWFCVKLGKFMMSDDIINGINNKTIPDNEKFIKMDYVDITKLEIDYLQMKNRTDLIELCLSKGENNFDIEFNKMIDHFPELKKQYYKYETAMLYRNAEEWCKKNGISYKCDTSL